MILSRASKANNDLPSAPQLNRHIPPLSTNNELASTSQFNRHPPPLSTINNQSSAPQFNRHPPPLSTNISQSNAAQSSSIRPQLREDLRAKKLDEIKKNVRYYSICKVFGNISSSRERFLVNATYLSKLQVFIHLCN